MTRNQQNPQRNRGDHQATDGFLKFKVPSDNRMVRKNSNETADDCQNVNPPGREKSGQYVHGDGIAYSSSLNAINRTRD